MERFGPGLFDRKVPVAHGRPDADRQVRILPEPKRQHLAWLDEADDASAKTTSHASRMRFSGVSQTMRARRSGAASMRARARVARFGESCCSASRATSPTTSARRTSTRRRGARVRRRCRASNARDERRQGVPARRAPRFVSSPRCSARMWEAPAPARTRRSVSSSSIFFARRRARRRRRRARPLAVIAEDGASTWRETTT